MNTNIRTLNRPSPFSQYHPVSERKYYIQGNPVPPCIWEKILYTGLPSTTLYLRENIIYRVTQYHPVSEKKYYIQGYPAPPCIWEKILYTGLPSTTLYLRENTIYRVTHKDETSLTNWSSYNTNDHKVNLDASKLVNLPKMLW